MKKLLSRHFFLKTLTIGPYFSIIEKFLSSKIVLFDPKYDQTF